MAKVTDDKNREFERSIEGQTAKGMAQENVDLFLQQIQPSLSVTGNVVFDLPSERLIPLAPAVPTCGDEQAIMPRFQPVTDKMLTAQAEG